MFSELHENKKAQLIIGFFIGMAFGSLLFIGGVTKYDVIIGQLLLTDFTVIKIMLTAVVVGMIGVYAMKSKGVVELHPKPGSFGSTVLGGIIFGAGFAVLGYCPGTVAGAVGGGSLDALFGGVFGILIGAGIFAWIYPSIYEKILARGEFKTETIPEALHLNSRIVVIVFLVFILSVLAGLEYFGL
ncbi:YeeE/YedE family protein [Methanoplanus sp. FWC-SCC4]|uniref:YeeE/YedE family protein n=1 Tax=Methanochimaera problematica TaxID=2609417 RepID=A0AA97FED7_9EURY|nr:YeeE/YedE family protein [Methanoplanus sp. FWC-SCC4]